jgi:hypothetical protein
MTVVIFAGPSIYGLDIAASTSIDINIQPPAKQGDIFRACLSKPSAIGLIDGYFDSVPSTWHKEILWALSQGIPVFGSASMGALRAAELDVFGMVGVGRIYDWYRDGVLEDDDEVALIHGPDETNFLPLSEPMVNVRATCEAAVAIGVLQQQTADAVIAAAKHIHYQDRTWQGVLASAREKPLAAAELTQFEQWKETGYVDQKQSDAAELIGKIFDPITQPVKVSSDTFYFEWTNLWDKAMQEWVVGHAYGNDAAEISMDAILDELRLDPELFNEVNSLAGVRSILLAEADRGRVSVDQKARLKVLGQLREKLGLTRKSTLDAWAKRNMLTEDALQTLVDEEARIAKVAQSSNASLVPHIISILQSRDLYAGLATRAISKRGTLKELLSTQPDGTAHNLPPPLVLNWFFGNRHNRATPADIDSFMQNLGLQSRQDFYRLLADEYVYSSHTKGGDGREP